jgi:molybdenum cofactor cytidylyltransferase
MSGVGLIILAAGASTRMGTPKQLLKYGRQSLICHVVEIAIASVCHPVIVVLGAYAESIQPEIETLPIHTVENPDWNQGMSSSIHVGIEALNSLNPNAEAVVLMLCDQPFVCSQLINQLVEVHQTTLKPIVASEYAANLGVPALFHRTLFPQLMTLTGASGAKQLINKYAHDVVAIPFPEGLIDLDTPQDYQQLLQL